MTDGVLRLAIGEQCRILVQHLQFEMVELVTRDLAERAGHDSHYFRFAA
jgi:hypothetical protein